MAASLVSGVGVRVVIQNNLPLSLNAKQNKPISNTSHCMISLVFRVDLINSKTGGVDPKRWLKGWEKISPGVISSQQVLLLK